MGEVLDSSRKGRLLESIGTMLFEPFDAAFDRDTSTQTRFDARQGYSESTEKLITQSKDADFGVWKVFGVITAVVSVMLGLWMLFNIASLFGQVFGL
jgi:hypothetical protein